LTVGEYTTIDRDDLRDLEADLAVAIAKIEELQKALRTTLGWRPAHLLNTDEKYLLALAYPPQTNPGGNAK
jgi:hypothetical protein